MFMLCLITILISKFIFCIINDHQCSTSCSNDHFDYNILYLSIQNLGYGGNNIKSTASI